MEKIKIIDLLREEGPEEAAEETWFPKTDQEADWWIEINQEELKEIERLEEQLQHKIANYQERLKKVQAEKEFKKERMVGKLIAYFESIPESQKKKTKTQEKYRLPSGEIIKKYPAPTIKRNETELLAWVKKQGDLEEFIETQEKVKWGELKKKTIQVNNKLILEETGEIIEGITLEERTPTIEIKTN